MMKNGKTGVLITFEGIDNAGKTTQMKLIQEELEKEGKPTLVTKEPFVELPKIAEVLVGASRLHTHLEDNTLEQLDKYNLARWTDVFLFAADRSEHVDKVIYPALRKGRIVLVHRYIHSSLAYQSYQGAGTEWIASVNHFAPKPDMVFYIRITPEESIRRKGEIEKYKPFQRYAKAEIEKHAFQIYEQIAKEEPNWVIIDGTKSIEEIHKDIMKCFNERFSFKTAPVKEQSENIKEHPTEND